MWRRSLRHRGGWANFPGRPGIFHSNPDAIRAGNVHRLPDGTLRLTASRKANLVKNSLFCTDVDPKATEITKMWPYILIADQEPRYGTTSSGKYRLISQTKPELFDLPNLSANLNNVLSRPVYCEGGGDK